MSEYKHYPAFDGQGRGVKISLVSGPVIIEDGKVLLDKDALDSFWKFPGGKLTDNDSPIAAAKREVKEELGLDIEIISEPFVIVLEKTNEGVKEYLVLIHYLAKRLTNNPQPGRDIVEWAWHEVNNLPADCADNIKPAVEHFLKK